ncbi:MAG: VOC family protein [Anaerolineae bacterium]
MNGITIIGAHHTCFTVADMSRSLAFYRDLLGLTVISEREAVTAGYFRSIIAYPDAVVHAVLLQIPGTTHLLELLEYKQPRGVPQDVTRQNPGAAHVCFMVRDIHSAFALATTSGAAAISEPTYLDQGPNKGAWGCYLKDPDGQVVELLQPAS